MRRGFAAAVALLVLAFSCAACAFASPQEYSFRMPREGDVIDAKRIADYRQAVDAIVWVMASTRRIRWRS